jgi:hypothetical protein
MIEHYMPIAIKELGRIFEIFNEKYFEGKLHIPVITVQSTKKRILGWCTLKTVWQPAIEKAMLTEEAEKKSKYEINICAQHLASPAYSISETMLHEMIHLYNVMNDISDCTNSYYHNKKFKKAAEMIGLVCDKDKKYGYGLTSLSPELKKYVEEEVKPDDKIFKYFREKERTNSGGSTTRKKRIFKYMCPKCGLEAKGKTGIHVVCKMCDKELEMEG